MSYKYDFGSLFSATQENKYKKIYKYEGFYIILCNHSKQQKCTFSNKNLK
jgi:hypothetical protein